MNTRSAACEAHVRPGGKVKLTFEAPREGLEDLPRRVRTSVNVVSETGSLKWAMRARGRIQPGDESPIQMKVSIPEFTPPGRYRCGCVLAGREVTGHVIVSEQVRVRVAPNRIVCNDDDERNAHTLTLVNQGNVPVKVLNPQPVILEPRERTCVVLRQALATCQERDSLGAAAFADALVRAAADSVSRDTLLAASLAGAPFELSPGESRLVPLTLRIPRPERGVYRARLYIAGAKIRVEVHSRHSPRGA
jgi:hypothetical protein